MAAILIVDDDPILVSTLEESLVRLKHDVMVSGTISDALDTALSRHVDLVFLDIFLPDGSGLNYIPDFMQTLGKPNVVIITGSTDVEGATLAIESGAWDYMCKPFAMSQVRLQVEQVLKYRHGTAPSNVCTALKREALIGASPKLNMCLDQVAQAASTTVNVLIEGETGTGKELFARAIHENSPRAEGPMVVLDCSVLPDHLVETALFGHEKGAFTGADRAVAGLIQQADKGVLFLDEVGELSLDSQKTFLRVLQEKTYRPVGGRQERSSNFRLVAATNQNLTDMVAQGRFREDLFFRLKAFTIDIPPLRERVSDIMDITLYHLVRICRQNQMETKGLSPEFIEVFEAYDWPGNVRELVNGLERAVAAAAFSTVLFHTSAGGRPDQCHKAGPGAFP